MERELVEVVTAKDHLCGSCTKKIREGTSAWRGEVELLNGKEEPITVTVFYHPKCKPLRARQVRRPHIDPRVAKRKGRRKKRQWR